MTTLTLPESDERVAAKKTELHQTFLDVDLYSMLVSPQRLSPKWVVAGILLGFLLCCVGGRILAGINLFQNFHLKNEKVVKTL